MDDDTLTSPNNDDIEPTEIDDPIVVLSDNDIVDGDVDELDEESDESHQREANGCGDGDLLELLPVGLGASLHQTHRVLAELSEGLQLSCDLVHLYVVVG